jgi:hypothetical protein
MSFTSFLPCPCLVGSEVINPCGYVAYLEPAPPSYEMVNGVCLMVFDKRKDEIGYCKLETGITCTADEREEALNLLMNSERVIVPPVVADHFAGLGDVGVYTTYDDEISPDRRARYEGSIIKIIV